MYADVIPKYLSQERWLFKAALEMYPKLAKPKGLVFEFIPGSGIRISAGEERLLVRTGVLILKHAEVPGSVEIVREGPRRPRTKEEARDVKA